MWCKRRSRALAVASASAGMITAHGYEATALPTRRAACRPVARPPHISTMCRGRSVGGSVPADLPEVGLPRPYIALGVAGQYHRAPGNAGTPRRAGGGSGWEGMDRVRVKPEGPGGACSHIRRKGSAPHAGQEPGRRHGQLGPGPPVGRLRRAIWICPLCLQL